MDEETLKVVDVTAYPKSPGFSITYKGHGIGVSEELTVIAVHRAFLRIQKGTIVERIEITPDSLIFHILEIDRNEVEK